MYARVVAWVITAVTIAGAIADTLITAQYRSLLAESTWAEHGWPLATAACVGSALMGLLVISRYPRNAVGWLLFIPALASISLSGEAYSIWVLDHGGPGSDDFAHLAAWVSVLVSAPLAITALTLIFLIAPEGRLPTRSRRFIAGVSVSGYAFYLAAMLTVPPSKIDFSEDPDVGLVADLLTFIGIILIGLALIGSAVSLVRRLRRASGVLRQQLRWIAFSASFIAAGLVIVLVGGSITGEQNWVVGIPLYLAYFVFPFCVAVAILRYQLLDIDLVINRAVLLAIATATVAVGYVALVVLIGGNAGGFWPSLAATAVVALAFQPLRTWVVRLADRLAYGGRAAPYEALADFSRQLGESPDPTTLLPAVADAAAQAVGAERATVRLHVDGGPDRSATRPASAAAVEDEAGTRVPVVDRDEELGAITVAMPPGRSLRPHDLDLLRGLADQASIAFRNIRLAADLAGQVDALRASTAELDESRRRLIEARDRERSRIERAIARDVMTHLEPLPGVLDRLAEPGHRDGTEVGDQLATLVDQSSTALEALREITRGVFPAQLVRGGLGPALTAQVSRSPGAGTVLIEPSAAGARFDQRVEAAAYFCAVEALRDLSPPVQVALASGDERLLLTVSGSRRDGLALANMRDRVEAVGGAVTIAAAADGTVLQVSLPLRGPRAAGAAS